MKALGGSVSRRQVLTGVAVAAIASPLSSAVASPTKPSARRRLPRTTPTTTTVVRYMAASAVLADGRILVVGGYDRPWTPEKSPRPLASAVIYDPGTNTWSTVEPMTLPRARHAAVTLADGRVAVLGGIHQRPTASVEIYNPMTGTWSSGGELAQPRYDHMAETDGYSIVVLGGSAQGMLSGVETFVLGAQNNIDA